MVAQPCRTPELAEGKPSVLMLVCVVAKDCTNQMALFDIITPEVEHGAAAATAEAIAVVESCFRTFPKLREAHEIHVSHSKSRFYLLFSAGAHTD